MYNGKNTAARPHITYNLDKACEISKIELKRYVNARFNIIYKGEVPELTKRLVARTMTYLEGYAAKLKEDMVPPVSINDVRTLLYSEGFKYIVKKIGQR